MATKKKSGKKSSKTLIKSSKSNSKSSKSKSKLTSKSTKSKSISKKSSSKPVKKGLNSKSKKTSSKSATKKKPITFKKAVKARSVKKNVKKTVKAPVKKAVKVAVKQKPVKTIKKPRIVSKTFSKKSISKESVKILGGFEKTKKKGVVNQPVNFHESIKRSPYERHMKKEVKSNLMTILYLSVLGLLVSIYLSYGYFSKGLIGSFSDYIDCSFIYTSTYGDFLGIPTPILAAIFFFVIAVFSRMLAGYYNLRQLHNSLKRKHVYYATSLISAIGLLFVIYYAIISFVVIKQVCIWCLVIDALIILIFIFALFNMIHYYKIRDEETHIHFALNK
ncbi:vitamin K epoxide reductase family protein [Candidatus Woesearchaeota archaeon]|jgi:uncharacterized membrane protein|nr:vitamin K epoxide reductase family protein [Candidatus Woesearchaeota archaeon]